MAKTSYLTLLTLFSIICLTSSHPNDELVGGIGKAKDDVEEFIHPTGTTGIVRGIIEDLVYRRKTTRRPKPGPGPHPTPGPDPEPDPIRRTTPSHYDNQDATYPGGNVIFQLTRKGLEKAVYYMQLFSDSWTKQFDIDNAQRDGQEIKNVRMIRGDPSAKVQGQFSCGAGAIEFGLTLPKVQASGNFNAKSGASGAFTSTMEDLAAVVQVAVKYSDKNLPNFYVKSCSGAAAKYTTLFRDASLAGSALDELRVFTESNLAQGFSTFACHGAKYLALVINTIFFDMDHSIYARIPTYDGALSAEINMSMVCGPDKVFTPPAKPEHFIQDIMDEVPGLSLDLRMNSDHAFFTDKQMAFGMRGDFRRDATGSGLHVPAVKPIFYTDRTMCLIINETFVQSFFEHAFDVGYFDLRQDVLKDDIPGEIRNEIYAFCPGTCNTFAIINATEPPVADFRKSSPKATAKLRVKIYGQSGNRVEQIVDGQIDIEVLGNVYYTSDTVKSYPEKGIKPKIQLHQVFLPDLLDKQAYVSDMIYNIYVDRLWPRIDARHKKMMQKRGIHLPIYCGFDFFDNQINYGDGQFYYCSNFAFSYDAFMSRFNQWKKDKGYV